MSDPIENARPGVNRRTILKASAWAIPVVAVAVGTPLAAASTGDFDVVITPLPDGTETGATSPDGLQAFTLALPPVFDVHVDGAPAPDQVTADVEISFDNRLLGGLTLTAEPGPVQLISSETQGNVQTVRFLLFFDLVSARLLPSFGIVTGNWVPDAQPYRVLIMIPSDPPEADISNNVATIDPIYFNTP